MTERLNQVKTYIANPKAHSIEAGISSVVFALLANEYNDKRQDIFTGIYTGERFEVKS